MRPVVRWVLRARGSDLIALSLLEEKARSASGRCEVPRYGNTAANILAAQAASTLLLLFSFAAEIFGIHTMSSGLARAFTASTVCPRVLVAHMIIWHPSLISKSRLSGSRPVGSP